MACLSWQFTVMSVRTRPLQDRPAACETALRLVSIQQSLVSADMSCELQAVPAALCSCGPDLGGQLGVLHLLCPRDTAPPGYWQARLQSMLTAETPALYQPLRCLYARPEPHCRQGLDFHQGFDVHAGMQQLCQGVSCNFDRS